MWACLSVIKVCVQWGDFCYSGNVQTQVKHFHNSFVSDKGGIRWWQSFDYIVGGNGPTGKFMWLPLCEYSVTSWVSEETQTWEIMQGKESDFLCGPGQSEAGEDFPWPRITMMSPGRAGTTSFFTKCICIVSRMWMALMNKLAHLLLT